MFLILFFNCHSGEFHSHLIHLDLKADYPEKELSLQDLFQVTYTVLDTDSSFIIPGKPVCSTDSALIFHNKYNGDVVFFHRLGGKKDIINRKGQGPEEYLHINEIAYDEREDELFCDVFHSKINVYQSNGTYLRSLHCVPGSLIEMCNYNDSLLLCYTQTKKEDGAYLYFVHKKYPDIFYNIDFVPSEGYVSLFVIKTAGNRITGTVLPVNPIVFRHNRWIYAVPSKDTIYELKADKTLSPILCRSPKVHETDPVLLLRFNQENEDYMLLSSIEKTYDFETREGFPEQHYLVDKKKGSVYRLRICNRDFSTDTDLDISFSSYYYSADKLLDALAKGKLSGPLKVLASDLQEEDNGIVMRLESI